MMFQSNNYYKNFFYSFYDFLKTTPFMRFYEIINSKINNNNSELEIYNQNNIKNLINEKKNYLIVIDNNIWCVSSWWSLVNRSRTSNGIRTCYG